MATTKAPGGLLPQVWSPHQPPEPKPATTTMTSPNRTARQQAIFLAFKTARATSDNLNLHPIPCDQDVTDVIDALFPRLGIRPAASAK